MKPFLRVQRTKDRELMAAYVAGLGELEQLSTASPEARLSLLSNLGAQACNLDLLEEARKYLETALALALKLHDAERELSIRLRLAITLQYLERLEQANEMFQMALKMTLVPELQPYQDTVLQHWGKLLAEQGKYAAARKCFEQALMLRQLKQDPELIADSEDALELLDSLGEVSPDGYLVTRTQIDHIALEVAEEEAS
ncbi:MAG: tetratricopeptide repeat protein [Candidatus Sericytochromatia bacterium]